MNIAAFQKYDSYRDSGIDWIGEVPAHWAVKRGKHLFREVNERSEDGTEELLSVSHTTGVTARSEKNVSMFMAEDYSGSKLCQPGDVVINTMWAWMGALGVSDLTGIISPSYGVYRSIDRKAFNPRYLEWLLRTTAFVEQYNKISTGLHSSRLRLYPHMFLGMFMAFPDRDEQDAITAFLDEKCATIDEAVRIKQEQITLLAERRQILIQEAVTRGLNPAAPMKDSGIDWIGQIPAHWSVRSIRYAFKFRNNQRIPLSGPEREHMQGQYPYYGASGIIDYVEDYIFDEDLILIAEDGANLLSKSTPLAFVARGKYWVNNHAHILEPLFAGFEYWAELLSAVDYTVYISGSAQPKLTRDRLASVRVPIPPIDEREAIVELIKAQSEKFRKAIELKQSQIAALREYKTSLINAAVTGKIKVI